MNNVFSVVVNAMTIAVRVTSAPPTGHKVETVTDRNIRYLLAEMFFAALAGGVATFNTAYAIRLGGSNLLISLLLSVPPLLTALVSIPSGLFLRQRRNKKWWSIGSLMLHRLGLLVAALVPILFPSNTAVWLVGVVLVFWIPLGFFDASWNSVMADLIPENRRASVFGRRAVLWAFGTMTAAWIASLFLDGLPFPMNYQVLYGAAFVATLISQYFLMRLSIPSQADVVTEKLPVDKSAKVVATNDTGIRRMIFNTVIYQIGWQMPIALLSMYYIRYLQASDGWLASYATVGSLGIILGYLYWAKVVDRTSFHTVIRRSSLLIWILPLIAILSNNFGLLLVGNLIASFGWSGTELSSIGAVLALSNEKNRPVYISWYIAAMNTGLFVGPLLGAWLIGILDSPAAVFGVALAIRVISAALFNINRVEAASTAPQQTAVVPVVVQESY